MRLHTIWTMPGMDLQERLRRTRDEYILPAVARAVPQRIQYWVLINNGAKYLGWDNEVVPEVPYTTVVGRMATRVERNGGRNL